MILAFVPSIFRPGNSYSVAEFRSDILAGITVAVIQIPQGMAFAALAGLPAAYGLYAALPGFIASMWGSSRQLSTGPVALVSLLTLTSLAPFAEPGSAEFIGLAALLALLVGIIYLLMGLFRLGFVMHLVPQSVIAGFSAAAALIIVLTQVPAILGIDFVQRELALQNIVSIFLGVPGLSLLTLLIATIAFVILVTSRKISRIFPGALVVLSLGILAGFALSLGDRGVALVGEIPASLPSFALPPLSFVLLLSLLPKAAIIALVGFVTAHATAKIVAAKSREQLDTNQELVGQGLANIVGGLFRGYPISGSLTRTAINSDAGARTGISGLVAGVITVFALLFLTPLFFYLPKAALASIVVLAALPLIDVGRLREMLRISRADGYVAFLTFGLTFLLRPDDAIFIGIVIALMFLIRQIAWGTRAQEMGVDKEWNVLRSLSGEDRMETFPGVCVTRISMSLYYMNTARLMREVEEVIQEHEVREKRPAYALVIDASSIHFVDITALELLEEHFEKLAKRGIRVSLIYLRRAVREALERMPSMTEITIIHNIDELRRYVVQDPRHTLVLTGSHPEKLGKRSG